MPELADWIDGVTVIDDGTGRPCNACIKAFTAQSGQVNPDPVPDTPTAEPNPTPNTPTSTTSSSGSGGGCSVASSFAGLAAMLFLFTKKRS